MSSFIHSTNTFLLLGGIIKFFKIEYFVDYVQIQQVSLPCLSWNGKESIPKTSDDLCPWRREVGQLPLPEGS